MQISFFFFLMQNKPLSVSHNCSTPYIYYICAKRSRFVWQNAFWLKALSSLSLSLTQSLWHQGVKLVVRNYALWQLPGQGGWHRMRSVVIHCLHQLPAALLVPCHSFACGTDHILQLSVLSWRTMRKTLPEFFLLVVMLVLNQFLPLALSGWWWAAYCRR